MTFYDNYAAKHKTLEAQGPFPSLSVSECVLWEILGRCLKRGVLMKLCTKKCSFNAKGDHWEQWHVMLDSRRLWYFVNVNGGAGMAGTNINTEILPLSYIDLPANSFVNLYDSMSSTNATFSISGLGEDIFLEVGDLDLKEASMIFLWVVGVWLDFE